MAQLGSTTIYGSLTVTGEINGTLTATKSDGTKAWELSQESVVLGTTEPAVKGTSQIGTAGNPFGSVWADNLNNNPITDTNNPTLSVDGATSIVGALNTINSHLSEVWKLSSAQRFPIDLSNVNVGTSVIRSFTVTLPVVPTVVYPIFVGSLWCWIIGSSISFSGQTVTVYAEVGSSLKTPYASTMLIVLYR